MNQHYLQQAEIGSHPARGSSFSLATVLISILLLCLAGRATLNAQPIATNHVLELDGNGSYVELPANLLVNLKEVTVEGLVKVITSTFPSLTSRSNSSGRRSEDTVR